MKLIYFVPILFVVLSAHALEESRFKPYGFLLPTGIPSYILNLGPAEFGGRNFVWPLGF